MKKYAVLPILLLAILVFSACAPKSDTPPNDEIIFKTEKTEYSQDAEKITLILENNTSNTIEYGYHIWLEKKDENGDWKYIEYKEGFGFVHSVLLILESGKSDSFEVTLSEFDTDMEKGTYRIGKNIDKVISDAPKDENTYYAEFVIT